MPLECMAPAVTPGIRYDVPEPGHLGCAVGTVKSRLARGRKRLRGRLVCRGVAPAPALAAASAGGAARAAVPTGLAESTVAYAANASGVPALVAVITEGVVKSMFLSNETGNIACRADFPNPDGLLRHGQTGTIVLHRKLHDATVIPTQAIYQFRHKRYVYVVDKDDVVHRREIVPLHEMDDICVINKGVGVGDKIVLEGIRKVHSGEKVEYEFRSPEEVMRKLKNHAE